MFAASCSNPPVAPPNKIPPGVSPVIPDATDADAQIPSAASYVGTCPSIGGVV